jgi:hypothetical protein
MQQILELLFINADNELLSYYGGPQIASCCGDLMDIWSAVLRRTLQFGHGGVFVLLPTEPIKDRRHIEQEYGIRCKYEISLELGEAYLHWAKASAQLRRLQYDNQNKSVSSESLREFHRLHNAYVNAEDSLHDTIRTVASLSATDGCVVLDRQLTVRGFGGEIRESTVGQTYRPLHQGDTDEVIPEKEIEHYGMRHRSACRFSQRYSDVFLFVISQDEELRLFHSDQGRAHRHDNLDAELFRIEID